MYEMFGLWKEGLKLTQFSMDSIRFTYMPPRL